MEVIMKDLFHEPTEAVILWEETVQTKDYWADRPFLSDPIRKAVAEAQVVLAPAEGFKDWDGPLFPTGTEEFYHFLKEQAPPEVPVEIAIDDTDYRELALCDYLTILVTLVVAPIYVSVMAGLILEYIRRRVPQEDAGQRFKLDLIISDAPGKGRRMSFEGTREDLQVAMQTLREVEGHPATEQQPHINERDDDSTHE